jgi:RNA recognition motif-containing protein
MSIRLYVGNLPKDVVDREAFQEVFADAQMSVTTKLIKDRKTGKCRGFGFVTVATDEEADQFIEKYNGHSFMESPLKIEKALPRTKGKEKEQEEASAKPAPKTAPAATGNRKNKKNQKKNNKSQTTTTSNNDSIQPDPRWATELAKLKEMLAAQTAN